MVNSQKDIPINAYGLTTPLTLASGSKMGKTKMSNLVRQKILSPYEYWQFWRNTDDRDVIFKILVILKHTKLTT